MAKIVEEPAFFVAVATLCGLWLVASPAFSSEYFAFKNYLRLKQTFRLPGVNPNVTLSSLQRCSNSNLASVVCFHILSLFRFLLLSSDRLISIWTLFHFHLLRQMHAKTIQQQCGQLVASLNLNSDSFHSVSFLLVTSFLPSVSTWQICRWPWMKTEHPPELNTAFLIYFLLV